MPVQATCNTCGRSVDLEGLNLAAGWSLKGAVVICDAGRCQGLYVPDKKGEETAKMDTVTLAELAEKTKPEKRGKRG